LWGKLLKEYCFLGERSSRFLDWRFNQSPHDEYQVFTLAYRKDMPFLGYVIFCADGRRVKVADIGFDGTEKSFIELISYFSFYQRAQGAESISLGIAGHPKMIKLLQKLGYSLRAKTKKVQIYAPPKFKTTLKSIKTGRWFLTLADNDI
jgi:hypothetical protein